MNGLFSPIVHLLGLQRNREQKKHPIFPMLSRSNFFFLTLGVAYMVVFDTFRRYL